MFLLHQRGITFGGGFLTATRKTQSHNEAVSPGILIARKLKDLLTGFGSSPLLKAVQINQ